VDIVVAFRMPPSGTSSTEDGGYLNRARSLCARAEALGGRLVGWSASMLAIAWDDESIEEAVLLAASVLEGVDAAAAAEVSRAWAGGVAEGELEPLAPDGQRMHLAWGRALLAAMSLARIARPGEVLVDSDVRALRAGQLTLRGARAATDSGQRVRGWRLDLETPWKPGASETPAAGLSTEEVLDIVERASQPPPDSNGPRASQERGDASAASAGDERAESAENGSAEAGSGAQFDAAERPSAGTLLAGRVRALIEGESNRRAVETLAEVRRQRAYAEGGPASARCQAALALSMTLCLAGRTEEALLEGLDALARSREAGDPRATSACFALLAKLYVAAGFADAAAALQTRGGS
jgi:hypothetical protein